MAEGTEEPENRGLPVLLTSTSSLYNKNFSDCQARQRVKETPPPTNSSELRTHHTMEFEKTNVFFLNISWVYVLVKILQRNRTNRVYILCVCLCEGREREGERLIIRNWPTHFWRLRSPSICSWQAGNLGEPVV